MMSDADCEGTYFVCTSASVLLRYVPRAEYVHHFSCNPLKWQLPFEQHLSIICYSRCRFGPLDC